MDITTAIRHEMLYSSNIRKSYLYRFLMDFQLWLPIWVLYLRDERGFSITQINLLDTPFFLLIVLAEVPTGAVADRWGRRTSLLLGTAFFAVAIIVFGLAENYLVILVSYVSWGLAMTFQSGADQALIYDSLKQLDREDTFPKVTGRLYAIRSAASVLGLLLGAPIAAATSYSFVIVLSAGMALCALPVAWSMHEPRHTLTALPERYFQTLFTGIHDVWRAPALRYIVLFSGILALGAFAPTIVFEQIFLDDHGVNTGALGLWQAPARAAGILAALSAAWILARAGERWSFFALPVAVAIACFAVAGIDSLWIFPAFFVLGAVHGLLNPLLSTYMNKHIPSERRATMLSVQSLAASVALSLQPVGGYVADTWGLQAAFLMYGLLTLVGGLWALALWDRAERGDIDRGEPSGLPEPEREPMAVR
jgi:MFS family permease